MQTIAILLNKFQERRRQTYGARHVTWRLLRKESGDFTFFVE